MHSVCACVYVGGQGTCCGADRSHGPMHACMQCTAPLRLARRHRPATTDLPVSKSATGRSLRVWSILGLSSRNTGASFISEICGAGRGWGRAHEAGHA